ncbi:hypothetical protein [uncultured Bifidobacterium sp.]|uniref:hypothetical protein n=1 Tax=uncultured Bifidobacterium sp. TaxID=165187 RepID=UPI0025994940|nr:hypothetical protein [uncultured Bifidobacterium sp.]
MTENNNSNADGERPNPTPGDGTDFDAAWAEFAADHADDLNDVERSRNAKRFEKHAQRKEKEALLSVDDLDPSAFAGGARRGPRDFTGSSWLDTDDVMDRYGEPFTPPNPDLGPVNKSKLVFWILLIVGVAGVIGSVFLPGLAAMLGTIFGACVLIGAAGLIVQHKGHSETRENPFDDGARV